jgi:hypothetical protein
MTDPTWKDPLLAKWWEGCSEQTRDDLGGEDIPGLTDHSPSSVLRKMSNMADYDIDPVFHRETNRLSEFIDAELSRGREAVRVLRGLEWSSLGNLDTLQCPECRLSRHDGHAPDCRLAKVIGGKP